MNKNILISIVTGVLLLSVLMSCAQDRTPTNYQLNGLIPNEGEADPRDISCLLSTEDGENYEATMVWQEGKYYTNNRLLKLQGSVFEKEGNQVKIQFSGFYDQDGLKNSRSKPPLPAIAWLIIDFEQFQAHGKSRIRLTEAKEEEMNWEFLSVQKLWRYESEQEMGIQYRFMRIRSRGTFNFD